MSGILNSKERVFDVIITAEGKRQMAAGTFVVRHASFTDAQVSYNYDKDEGHVDPTGKIYFEAANLPQDKIVFEANDAGQLVPFKDSITVDVNKNQHHPTSKVSANLVGGKLTTFEYHHGRTIIAKPIRSSLVKQSTSSGFNYSDYNGLTGSIYVDKNIDSGVISYTSPAVGKPYKAKIGTKDGLSAELFATRIHETIEKLKSDGGPAVKSLVKSNTVYLDVGDSFFGNVLRKISTEDYNPVGKNSIFVLNNSVVGGTLQSTELTDSEFAGQITDIFESSFNNFLDLQIIGTFSDIERFNDFVLTKNEVDLDFNDLQENVYTSLQSIKPTVDSIDSLFADKKLSHVSNFRYMPPILRPTGGTIPDAETIARYASSKVKSEITNVKLLGNYVPFGNNREILKVDEIKAELERSPKQVIEFNKTSRENNVICQMFEVADGKVTKLDVIERTGITDRGTDDEKNYKVFFVGKTYVDNGGTQCFVNMFTLTFNLSDDRNTD